MVDLGEAVATSMVSADLGRAFAEPPFASLGTALALFKLPQPKQHYHGRQERLLTARAVVVMATLVILCLVNVAVRMAFAAQKKIAAAAAGRLWSPQCLTLS